ncbi:unnamed protein product [Brassica rapa]|uniref:RING-CH-type domain-containing protein n=1 Tax=Brassica campestris TaxID=3711 RepID=A0A3P5YYJ5_BRACM|nr:unnamed protein product [Brassica rapa]VDC72872.1 unnamed protein product [Brassica rapa]
MDVSPESFSAEDDEDQCRICRSPEEPGNPLRYPCLCRGSIKFVHQHCLRTWLNRRRGNNKCEVCGRSYSFVPVYSENAPERLPCDEFLIGVLSRAGRYLKLIVAWIVVILFNVFCIALHPLGQEYVAGSQRVFMSRKLAFLWATLLYSTVIASSMLILTTIRIQVGDLGGGRGDSFFGNGGVLHLLSKYMKILCDWYFHKLIHFLGQPPRLIFLPPEAPLHEFGVVRRVLFFLDDDAFAVLGISVYVSTLFILLPFSIGWVVLATVGGSYLSGNSPVILGYMMMLSICFAYFGILFILHQNPFPLLARWFSLGFHFITVTLPCHLLAFLANILLIKDAFVLFFKFGVLPWIVGWFLGICTSPMFGTRRLSCLIIAVSYMKHIPKIMHKRAYWYLLDVTDPDYKITKLNLRHVFFVFASHGVLLVILFRLPIKAITLISPSFFPLELWDRSPFIGVAYVIYVNLMHAGSKWLIELTKPAIALLVHKWIVTVCSWLLLSDLLLVVPRGEEDFHYADDKLLYSLAEGSMVTFYKSQNDEDDIKEQRDNRYRTRIAILLMLAALSLFLVSTAFMTLPIVVGRVFSYSISFILRRFGITHDEQSMSEFAFDHILNGRTDLQLIFTSGPFR